MPLYIADYLKDTSHLRALESGAYLHLIMAYWVSGGLPNDDRQLATIAKLTDREWKIAKPVLQSFFDENWRHKRIDQEIQHATEISNKRKAAAQQRHQKQDANADANAPPNADTLHTSQYTKEEKKEIAADAASPRDELWKRGTEVLTQITGSPNSRCRSMIGKWLAQCQDQAIVVLAAIDEAAADKIIDPIPWITAKLKTKSTLSAIPQVRGDDWDGIVDLFKKTGKWSRWAGPEPGQIGCRAPPEILKKYGVAA